MLPEINREAGVVRLQSSGVNNKCKGSLSHQRRNNRISVTHWLTSLDLANDPFDEIRLQLCYQISPIH